ncbi:MAG: SWIM zinc finger family protein [Akkermansia sp.]
MKVADLKERAETMARQLEQEGQVLHPVCPKSKNMATHFWGKAWMKHLSESEVYGMRLAPGRTYLRNGCVLDVSINEGRVDALVMGEYLYEVHINIAPLDEEAVGNLQNRCAGRIGSWVDLLQGQLSDDLLHLLCDVDAGVLPDMGGWRMSCTCPDYADPCKHASAVLYAVGVLLDESPELLFTLRGIRMEQLLPALNHKQGGECTNSLDVKDLSSLFGIDLEG